MIRRIIFFSLLAFPAFSQPDGAMIYADQCAGCHAATRLGGTGPALIPESLGRIKGDALTSLIAKGRTATQMPAFANTLSPADIAAVASYIASPLATPPVWTETDIAATREMTDYTPATAPLFTGDPLNITLVVETGDSHVSVLVGFLQKAAEQD